jgi:cysteine-rich repeat protein
VCRPAVSNCDIPEVCSGQSTACPADTYYANGTYCDDNSTCTATSFCYVSVAGTLGICWGPDVYCQGVCGDGILATAEQCDDGNLNGNPSDCCSSTCKFVATTQICR